jgi:hypothetical protein
VGSCEHEKLLGATAIAASTAGATGTSAPHASTPAQGVHSATKKRSTGAEGQPCTHHTFGLGDAMRKAPPATTGTPLPCGLTLTGATSAMTLIAGGPAEMTVTVELMQQNVDVALDVKLELTE